MTKRLRVGDRVDLDLRAPAPLPAPAGPQTPDAALAVIEKATKTAQQWAFNVGKLQREIQRREASGRGETKALKAARERLVIAERRQAEARSRLDQLKSNPIVGRTAGERKKSAERDKREVERSSREEAKKISKRKKAIERRTTKDLRTDTTRERFGIRRRRQAAAPIVADEAETWPTGPIVPYVAPKPEAKIERAGLLPGDFRLIARVDDFDLYRPPKEWSAAHVGDRFVEAHRVLLRLPMTTHPKAFGSAMPEYINEGVELAYQAGAGTLRATRAIKGTSANEVARCNEAIGWPLTYLKNDVHLAFEFNSWAFDCATGDGRALDGFALEAARKIADGLNKAKVKVT